MSTDLSFVEFVCDQLSGAGEISFRKMFGEYAIYCDGKVVALACDDQLFVKPTPAGQEIVGEVPLAPPYPGAKPHFLIDSQLDDPELMVCLIQATAKALPAPKPKKKRTQVSPSELGG